MTESCVTFRADGGFAIDVMDRPTTLADVADARLPEVLPDLAPALLHPMVEGRREQAILRVPDEHAACMSAHLQHVEVVVAPSALNSFCFVYPELFVDAEDEEQPAAIELFYAVDDAGIFAAWAEAGYPLKWDVHAPTAREAA